jgi:hypothetical protein
VELHGVAHVDVEQVIADQPGRDLGRSPWRTPPVLLVADLHLEQVVAGGGGVVDAEVALPEGVQQAHAHEPVVVAPIGSAAQPHRRHARDIAAVGEGCAHEVIFWPSTPKMPGVATGTRSHCQATAADSAADSQPQRRVSRHMGLSGFIIQRHALWFLPNRRYGTSCEKAIRTIQEKACTVRHLQIAPIKSIEVVHFTGAR